MALCRDAWVRRGERLRFAKVLPLVDPIGEKLAAGEVPTPDEIERVARVSFARADLYQILKLFERLDLFPQHLKTPEAQAEATLVYWLIHPNEMQDAPEDIELVEKVVRELDGDSCDFFVFRYRMPDGHWAAGDGWQLGVSGPFRKNDLPYSDFAGAFSRFDKYGEVEPSELVDWYIRRVTGRRA